MGYRISDAAAVLVVIGALALSALEVVRQDFSPYGLLMAALPVAMLLVGGWWLGQQPRGTPFREMAIPATVATVTPLLVGVQLSPLYFESSPFAWLLSAAAAAIVGLRLADAVPDPGRRPTMLLAAASAALAASLGLAGRFIEFEGRATLGLVAMVLVAATTVVPGVVGAVLRHTSGRVSPPERADVVRTLELAVIGLTPGIAVVTVWGTGRSPSAVAPLIVWILGVLTAQFFAVRPLANRATVATSQRDAVVAAMEAERSRIAADIHDDALQELTMLGWRLDQAGDREGAATAREVADRLRAILGDLRLPILDDLGTGPALEWLVDRVGRLTGAEVRLERSDAVRPPPEVELAFFRVAQEAISNAIRHGRPPVVVRYWTSPSAASLAVDDAGQARAEEPQPAADGKRFGLLNMAQRAEQIGALLNVRSWPTGGTRVTLEWRA